ncbi:MAG: hypothetical protein Q9169_005561 [Polycauliona sp. 2 TL-2023]
MEDTANFPRKPDLDAWTHNVESPFRPQKIQITRNAIDKSSRPSRPNFLMIPAEIRLRIYSFSLISASPVIVWSAYCRWDYYRPRRKVQSIREIVAASREDLALGLLRCCTKVAAESAQIFYSRNTFRFEGQHEYYPVITWLDKLDRNRDYLAKLEISVRRPSIAWQLPDGSRYSLSDSNPRRLASHHPYFASPLGSYEEGLVDIVDPAVETIISLLAKHQHSDRQQKMTLCLDTGYDNIPGIELFESEDMSLFSLDLPNLVDIWQRQYFSDPEAIRIIWKIEGELDMYNENRHLIEGLGWNIFHAQEGEFYHDPHGAYGPPDAEEMVPSMQFWMTRDAIVGPIMAAGPDPYTQSHYSPFRYRGIPEHLA